MKQVREGYKMTELGEIPQEWEVKKLETIIKSTQLGTNTLGKSDIKNGVPLLKMGNLNIGGFSFTKIEYIEKNELKKNEEYILKKGDFLFNTRNTLELVGKSAVWNENLSIAIFNSNIMRIKFTENIDDFYISFYFSYNRGWKSLKSIAKGTTSVGAIYTKDLLKIKIPVPPLPEQKKIASILSKVDEQIELTDNLIEKTKDLKKGLMQNLLSKGIGHTEFKETEIGKIPTGWEVKRLEDICEILDSMRKPLNQKQRMLMKGNIPYYGANSIVDYINDYIFDDEIILIAEDGGNFFEYKDKPIAFYIKEKCWVNNHTHVLKAKENKSSLWIYYSLVHKDITDIVQGGTRSKLNQKDLRKIIISFPPLPEQKKIASILSSVDIQIEEYQNKKSKLEELKKGLMQQLLTGKIRVKVDSDIYALVNQEVCENI